MQNTFISNEACDRSLRSPRHALFAGTNKNPPHVARVTDPQRGGGHRCRRTTASRCSHHRWTGRTARTEGRAASERPPSTTVAWVSWWSPPALEWWQWWTGRRLPPPSHASRQDPGLRAPGRPGQGWGWAGQVRPCEHAAIKLFRCGRRRTTSRQAGYEELTRVCRQAGAASEALKRRVQEPWHLITLLLECLLHQHLFLRSRESDELSKAQLHHHHTASSMVKKVSGAGETVGRAIHDCWHHTKPSNLSATDQWSAPEIIHSIDCGSSEGGVGCWMCNVNDM